MGIFKKIKTIKNIIKEEKKAGITGFLKEKFTIFFALFKTKMKVKERISKVKGKPYKLKIFVNIKVKTQVDTVQKTIK